MKKIKNFLKESYIELTQKVNWPTLDELQESSIVVLLFMFILALIIFLVDFTFNFLIHQIYNIF